MKKILLALLALTLSVAAFAKPVDESVAKSIAESFLRRPSAARLTCKGKVPAEVKRLRSPLTASQASQPAWYVFNFDGGGFVIVSGEDVTEPILGYSDTGHFDYDNAPSNIRWWMDGLASDIAVIKSDPSLAAPRTATYNPDTHGNIKRQYQTAKWYQDAPYNNECPKITRRTGSAGSRGLTGCVATAGAIVMRYFQWPDKGEGTTQAYTFLNENNVNQTVPANTLGRTYNWSNMIMNYGGSYTSAQASAVAAIMFDVGTSAQMQYGTSSAGGSGTFDQNLLAGMQKHFKYSKKAYRACRESYTDSQWLTLLKENLDNIGPMPYGGADDDGGHEFVFDGYTDRNYFSVNWGWGGEGNGWFLVSSLTMSGYTFSVDQSSLLGLEPDKGGQTTYEDRLLVCRDTGYPGMQASVSTFTAGRQFTVKAGPVYNDATMPFSGNLYIARYDKLDNWKENISQPKSVSNMENLYIYYTINGEDEGLDNCYAQWTANCNITGPIKGGDRLRIHFEGQNSSGFAYADASDVVWEIVIAEDNAPTAEEIAAGTSLSYEKASRKLTLKCAYNIDCTVKDSSGAVKMTKALEQNVAGVLDFSSLPSGTYRIILTGSEDYTLSFKL
ncbi:MAG: C10 family peptidase [Bacteroidales bacterium]|nr:C10 family peptidase [Bacteroidales bacterium]